MSTIAADPFAGLRGVVRPDGRVGLRDRLVILSTVALTDRWAELAADAVPDTCVIAPALPRGLRGEDVALADRLLDGLALHPNTGAALLLTQDAPAARALRARFGDAGRPVEVLALLEQDGMEAAVARARQAARDLAAGLGHGWQEVGAQALSLALECGGSDASSALAANPAIGRLVDLVLARGGRAVVSETVEFIGAEPAVAARCATPALRDAILGAIARREAWMTSDGVDYRGTNPTAENIAGGLTTLIEKSLGAVVKTGQAPFAGNLGFAEPPAGPGLHFMDTPFFTPVSLTGMVAAGCNAVLFALGQFNPSAHPLAPTLKICGNRETWARWASSMDVDLCDMLDKGLDREAAAHRIAGALVAASGGAPTAAERWGEGQTMPHRVTELL